MWRPLCPYTTSCRFRVGNTCCLALVNDPSRDCQGKGAEVLLQEHSLNPGPHRPLVLIDKIAPGPVGRRD
jgi:hypothetical protein